MFTDKKMTFTDFHSAGNEAIYSFAGKNNAMENSIYETRFENAISSSLRDITQKLLTDPSQTMTMLNIYRKQKNALKIRKRYAKIGITIPPVAIFSITENCNLKCRGCYAACKSVSSKTSVTAEQFSDVIRNLSNHGTRIVMIAGGEPFTCEWVTEKMGQFKDVLFIVFTNGLFLHSGNIRKLRKSGNIIPVISIEGNREQTNERRGQNVYEKVMSVCSELSHAGIMFGFSHTVNSENVHYISSEHHIGHLMSLHPRVIFNVEYVPVEPGTEQLMLKDKERQYLISAMQAFRQKHSALFITMPGDEEQWGGCLAAGRGFFHINPAGEIEPCPFAAISPGNIFNTPLLQLLQSDIFTTIRDNRHLLTETEGGCALWNNKELFPVLIQKKC